MTMIRPTQASNPDLPITVGRQRVPRRYQHRQDGQIWREGADLGLLPTPNFVKNRWKGIRPFGAVLPKTRNFWDLGYLSSHFYTYNVEICVKRTDIGNIRNPSTTQNFVRINRSRDSTHGLPVLLCLGGDPGGDAYWFLVAVLDVSFAVNLCMICRFYRPTFTLRSPYGTSRPSVCLSVVSLSSLCRLWRSCALPRGLTFSATFLHHLMAYWPG